MQCQSQWMSERGQSNHQSVGTRAHLVNAAPFPPFSSLRSKVMYTYIFKKANILAHWRSMDKSRAIKPLHSIQSIKMNRLREETLNWNKPKNWSHYFIFFVVIAVCSKWITIYSWEISESKQKCVCVCDETQNCAHTLRHNDAIEYLLLFHWEKKSRIIILILIEISIWRRTRKSRQETIWGSERQLSAPPPPPLEKDHRTGQCFPIMRINKAKTIIGWKMPISRQREIAFQMELS